MGERRALVVGSQVAQLGELPFLPGAAADLYAVLIDPDRGGCVPALQPSGLLIDPTVTELDAALQAAWISASEREATLFFAFVGHGEFDGSEFCMLPVDAQLEPLNPLTVVNLMPRLGALVRSYSRLDGFVALLDACFSGEAAAAATHLLTADPFTMRYEILVAAADRPAADGCFTRTITAALRRGLPETGTGTVRLEALRGIVGGQCTGQQPQHTTWNADPGLFLSKNVALRGSAGRVAATPAMNTVEDLTNWLEPTTALRQVVEQSIASRSVVVVGAPGSGKSTLAAALTRVEATNHVVPEDFVQASLFVSSASDELSLAATASHQLVQSVAGFAAAARDVEDATPETELESLPPFARYIAAPLSRLPEYPVRIVIDALDQLDGVASAAVIAGLDQLMTDPQLSHVRTILTTRPQTPYPSHAIALAIGEPEVSEVEKYLERRGLSRDLAPPITQEADGNWLVMKLLADLATTDGFDANAIPAAAPAIFARLLTDAARDQDDWEHDIRPILEPLAAAGIGPVLPLHILCEASGRQGGPTRVARVRDVVVRLRSLIARGEPGGDNERLGLFHGTLADYLDDGGDSEFAVEVTRGHQAIVEALEAVAPASEHDEESDLHHYAALAEPRHLLALGDGMRALMSRMARESPIPLENLARWSAFAEDAAAMLTGQDLVFWVIRRELAAAVGRAGDPRTSVEMLETLVSETAPDAGPDHELVLQLRYTICLRTKDLGEYERALDQAVDLLPAMEAAHGRESESVYGVRNVIASLTGNLGNPCDALRLARDLLPLAESLFGNEATQTFVARNNAALWLGRCSDPQAALAELEVLLEDRLRVMHKDHPDVLDNRGLIAGLTAETGDTEVAERLFAELREDQERVLTPDHWRTLQTRYSEAAVAAQRGERMRALEMLRALLINQQRVLGASSRFTADTLAEIHRLEADES
jgi:hypothetical protein